MARRRQDRQHELAGPAAVLGQAGRDPPPPLERRQSGPPGVEGAQVVREDLPVGAGRSACFGEAEPVLYGFRCPVQAGVAPEEQGNGAHPDAVFLAGRGTARTESAELLGQAVVPRLQGVPRRTVLLFREPKAEARAPIVVPGQLIVDSEALRAGTRQPGGQLGQEGGELIAQTGKTYLEEKAPAEAEARALRRLWDRFLGFSPPVASFMDGILYTSQGQGEG
jgi:hypothetical protein